MSDERPKRRELRRRMRDGVEEFCCTQCTEWLEREAFIAAPTAAGIRGTCRKCESERTKARYRREPEKVRAEKRRAEAKRRKADKKADREYTLWLERSDRAVFVQALLVRPWIELLLDRAGGARWMVAQSIGVSSTQLDKIMSDPDDGEERMVRHATAERIAILTENQYALATSMTVPGVEGWSRHGDVCCRACGTVWHRHVGHGLCAKCYGSHRRVQRTGRPSTLTRDQGRWSLYWPCCRACGGRERKHAGRGLCTLCRKRLEAAGKLHLFPTLTNRGKHVTERWRGTDHGQGQATG